MNDKNLQVITGILQSEGFSERVVLIVLGTGIAGLIISAVFSILIIRNRDNE